MRSKRKSKRQPSYPLRKVKQLVAQKKYLINENARDGARESFGWSTKDIVDAICKLRTTHYHKTAPSKAKRNPVPLDFYKAYGLKGEDVYTHFYVDPHRGWLVVNSFKGI